MKFLDRLRGAADHLMTGCRPMAVVWLAFCMVVVYTVILAVIDPVFSRDAGEYVYLVEAFRMGAMERAFPPNLPSLYTLAAGLLSRLLPIPSMTSLLLINGLALACSVFPLYGIWKRCVPARWAAWGTALFAVIPKMLEDCIAPQVDSGRMLFFLLAFYFILKDTGKVKVRSLLTIGLSYGMLILVRAEGILLVGILCFIHLLKILFSDSRSALPARFGCAAGRICITLAVALAVISPRMIQMYRLTGIPVVDSRQSNAVKGLLDGVKVDPPVVGAEDRDASRREFADEESGRGWITTDPERIVDQPRFFRNFPESFYWTFIPFTALGILFFIFRRKRPSFRMTMLILTFVLTNLMYFLMRAGAGRYMLFNPCLAMPFTLIGMNRVIHLAQWCLGRFRRLLVLPLIAAACVMVVYSWKNLPFRDKNRDFKEMKRHLSGRSSRNPDLDRPVVLMIGADRGIGYYSGVNVIWYYRRSLHKRHTPEEIIRDGVSTECASHWTTAKMPEHVHIDAVVLDGKNEADTISSAEHLLELAASGRRLKLYRVRQPVSLSGRALPAPETGGAGTAAVQPKKENEK